MKRLLLPMILMILITGVIFVSCAKEKPDSSVDTEKTETDGAKVTAKTTSSSKKTYSTPSRGSMTTTTFTGTPVYWPTTTKKPAAEEKKEEAKKEEVKKEETNDDESSTPVLPPQNDKDFPAVPEGMGDLPSFSDYLKPFPSFPSIDGGSSTPPSGSGSGGDTSITLGQNPGI